MFIHKFADFVEKRPKVKLAMYQVLLIAPASIAVIFWDQLPRIRTRALLFFSCGVLAQMVIDIYRKVFIDDEKE